MTSLKAIAEFKLWWDTVGHHRKHHGTIQGDEDVALEIWNESRAQITVILPDHKDPQFWDYNGLRESFNAALYAQKCQEALTQAGVGPQVS